MTIATNGDGEYRTFRAPGFGTLMRAPSRRARRRPRRSPPAARTCAAGCRRSTRTATSGCASSARSRRCSTRSSRSSTRCPRTSTPTSPRATSSSLLAAWLGVELDESQRPRDQREMVRRRRSSAAGAARGRASSWRCDSPSPTCRCASKTTGRSSGPRTPATLPRGAAAVVRRLLRRAARRGATGRGGPTDRAGQAGPRVLSAARQGRAGVRTERRVTASVTSFGHAECHASERALG